MDSAIERRTGLQDVAGLLASTTDLEGLVRPLLELITRTTAYEVAYLSVHDRATDHQVWRFVHTAAGVGPPEGQTWPWEEVLCHWVEVRGRHAIVDLATEIPGHPSNQFLGVRGFVSIPYSLVGRGGELGGTLCATSRDPVEPAPDTIHLLKLFANLAADRFAREVERGHERIRADAAERQLVERTRLVASAEHALKTPLMIVSGWAETLETNYDDLDDDGRREAVAHIRTGAKRLGEHVDRLLDDAQATILGAELRPVRMELAAELPALVREFAGALSTIDVVVGDLDGTVLVDARALEQILGHLLENAAKYASGGTVEVSSVLADGEVVLSVEDDGPGFGEGVDVFAPFTRGEGASDRPGVGLGMHIVRRLAEASGGRVRAVRGRAGGARFDVALPLP